MSRERGEYYTMPTLLGFIALVITGVMFSGLIFLMDSNSSLISPVRLESPCQDGRRVRIPVPESEAEAVAEFEKRGCVRVDGAGNILKFDPNTAEAIYFHPVTGQQVEGVD